MTDEEDEVREAAQRAEDAKRQQVQRVEDEIKKLQAALRAPGTSRQQLDACRAQITGLKNWLAQNDKPVRKLPFGSR
jgi:DNA-binding transcriptional MerR regulator